MKRDWEINKLSEIGNIFNGNSINEGIKKEKYAGNKKGLPYIGTKDLSSESVIDYDNGIRIPYEETAQFRIAPKNTVLICAEGGSAGRKIGFTSQDVCFGNKLFAINTNKNVESRFVYYYCFSPHFQKQFSTELAGLIGGVSINKFRNISIPRPALIDQKRIVSMLDESLTAIATAKKNAENNLRNSRELFEAYSQSVFTRPSKGWQQRTLDQVCMVERGSSPRPIKNYFTNKVEGINWIKISDAKEGEKYIYSTAQKITSEGAGYSRFVKEGDFILTNSMSFGRPYIMKTRGCIHDGWFVLRLNDSINADYFYYLLSSRLVQSQFNQLASGSVVKNISGDLVKKAILPIPPIGQQHNLVKKLLQISEETKKLEAIYQHKLAGLDELKKSILQQAFNGDFAGVRS